MKAYVKVFQNRFFFFFLNFCARGASACLVVTWSPSTNNTISDDVMGKCVMWTDITLEAYFPKKCIVDNVTFITLLSSL